ncbi:MAG: FIST C-terminal domain-containing protein [Spirochaetales bacterium]|jgi:hypothetical protein|nr:FIST C-terminal domain-containing protein [Spirochaetales bacterium]
MIRALSAYTLDPDDVTGAVDDILSQLDLEKKLLKHSAGLLFCYRDFIQTGVVKALCSRLPFDVIGCTSQGVAVAGAADEIMLVLMVMTSDESEFALGLSEPMRENAEDEARIGGIYGKLSATLGSPPSLMFTFLPLLTGFTGDFAVGVLDRLSGGVPVFGSVSLDMDTEMRSPMTIYNGEAYEDRLTLMVLSGETRPDFFLDSVPERNISNQKAVITAAEGSLLISIDNMPAVDYMQKIGLIVDGRINALFAFPVLADSHDGTEPKILTFYELGGNGSLVCASRVPVGATLHIASPTTDMVLETAVDITNAIKKNKNWNGLLIFSCISRNMTLADPMDEMKMIAEQLRDSSGPYVFIYSAGELCPRRGENGNLSNCFNLYSIIACTFGGEK